MPAIYLRKETRGSSTLKKERKTKRVRTSLPCSYFIPVCDLVFLFLLSFNSKRLEREAFLDTYSIRCLPYRGAVAATERVKRECGTSNRSAPLRLLLFVRAGLL